MNPYEFPGWPRADYIPPVFFSHFRSLGLTFLFWNDLIKLTDCLLIP